MAAPLVALAALAALIYFLGGGQFGRAQSQAWIDRTRQHPRVHAFLDRHHGKFRAATHYFEFGGLFLVLYWLYDRVRTGGEWQFSTAATIVIALICAGAAYLDELHQLRSGTRQFRKIDFVHSCLGISVAAIMVFIQAAVRGNF